MKTYRYRPAYKRVEVVNAHAHRTLKDPSGNGWEIQNAASAALAILIDWRGMRAALELAPILATAIQEWAMIHSVLKFEIDEHGLAMLAHTEVAQ